MSCLGVPSPLLLLHGVAVAGLWRLGRASSDLVQSPYHVRVFLCILSLDEALSAARPGVGCIVRMRLNRSTCSSLFITYCGSASWYVDHRTVFRVFEASAACVIIHQTSSPDLV